jgi:cell division protein FtsW
VSLACAIVGFGLVMVYSASITSWPTDFEQVYLSRQLTALGLAAVLAVCCASLPADFYRRWSPLLLAGTILLLAVVLIPGIGTRVNGARRWLRCGGLQFQPSELAKLALTLYLCRQAVRPGVTDSLRGTFLWIVAPVLLTAGLVLVEPDLGTALFLIAFACLALFVGGWPRRHFLVAGLLTLPAAGFAAALRPYQMRRMAGFVDAWSDWSRLPYQLEQSLVSFGSGGLWGVGLGRGWQKLSFLPEANTDFVFAVVGEELGLLGTASLVLLWAGFYGAGLRCIYGRRGGGPPGSDRFASTAALALLTQLALQAAANMAVVTALLPPKGIPLPLVSYGGSALLTSLASVGIIVSLTRQASIERGPSGP